jgi:hypothetical protein
MKSRVRRQTRINSVAQKEFVVPERLMLFGREMRVVVERDDAKALQVEVKDEEVVFWVKKNASERFIYALITSWQNKQLIDFAAEVVERLGQKNNVFASIDFSSKSKLGYAFQTKPRREGYAGTIIVTNKLMEVDKELAEENIAHAFKRLCRRLK